MDFSCDKMDAFFTPIISPLSVFIYFFLKNAIQFSSQEENFKHFYHLKKPFYYISYENFV